MSTTRYSPPGNQEELLHSWIERTRESQHAHYEMATIYQRRHKWLGVPVIVITTAIGTSAFASLSAQSFSSEAKVILGIFSMLAAILSSLQTFFKFSDLSEKHRVAAAGFGEARRNLEAKLALNESAPLTRGSVDEIQKALARLAKDSPSLPLVGPRRAGKTNQDKMAT